ncbi:hypothetical protein HDE_02427 [Halotydeus destructor]|nr:hypothetical protein HDE_02427 [Halotydeus destructor]
MSPRSGTNGSAANQGRPPLSANTFRIRGISKYLQRYNWKKSRKQNDATKTHVLCVDNFFFRRTRVNKNGQKWTCKFNGLGRKCPARARTIGWELETYVDKALHTHFPWETKAKTVKPEPNEDSSTAPQRPVSQLLAKKGKNKSGQKRSVVNDGASTSGQSIPPKELKKANIPETPRASPSPPLSMDAKSLRKMAGPANHKFDLAVRLVVKKDERIEQQEQDICDLKRENAKLLEKMGQMKEDIAVVHDKWQ